MLRTWCRLATAVAMLAGGDRALAQEVRGGAVAADAVVSWGQYVDAEGNSSVGPVLDGFVTYQASPRVQLLARPALVRSRGEWLPKLCQLAVRYEDVRRVGIRLEAGHLAPTVGLGMLQARANLNPTIANHPLYYQRLPPFEAGTPRANLVSMSYPLGAQAALSGARWDARVALQDSSPTRPRPMFGDGKPPRSPQFVTGGGVTPWTGLRLGASLAHGGYARAHEVEDQRKGDREATLVGLELEYAVRHTKVTGEWLRSSFETASSPAVATGWSLQAEQTLTPRWSAALRIDRAVAPGPGSTPARSQSVGLADVAFEPRHPTFTSAEGVLAYRLSRETTLRVGYLTRRAFGSPDWRHQVGASVVWTQQWGL